MSKNYIFDVDGTLTPSRGTIDAEFKKQFLEFTRTHNVSLVTGSDRPKTLEQLGDEVYNSCARVYNCSGNDVYAKDKQLSRNAWSLPAEAGFFLINELDNSGWKIQTGLHIEDRPGMVNFSVVGRHANKQQRADYYQYDKQVMERTAIAERFNKRFPELSAKVGGETGIDIFQKGCDKSQILKDFDLDSIKFYGDRVDLAGNDYPLAVKLKQEHVFAVTSWKDTQRLLANE
jgi:phosphomannomutase